MGEMAQKVSLSLQTTTGFMLFYRVVPFATFLRKAGLISSISVQGRFRSCAPYTPFFPQRFGQGDVLYYPLY